MSLMPKRPSLDLLYLLVVKDLKVRYKHSLLGYFWALLHPLAFALVYWVAFKLIMRIQMENYSVFLITGMFPWLWLTTGLTQATQTYQANAPLVKRVRLQRYLLPLSSLLNEMVHFFFALPVIYLLLAVAGQPVHWNNGWQVPLLVALQLAFAFPIGILLSLANVFVKDVEYLVGIGFSLLFFATPMVYPLSMVPEAYRPFFEASPLHALIQTWRDALLLGRMNWGYFAYLMAWTAGAGALAYLAYRRYAPRIAESL